MTSRTTNHISPMPGHVISVGGSATGSIGGAGSGSDSGGSPTLSVTSGSPNHSSSNGSASFSHQQHHQHGPIGSGGSNSSSSGGGTLYPSISAAYWLPAPNPTPYLLPERKLFIGMLNKKYSEQDVRQMFGSQGSIEECTVLRDQNGQSKGCAFVTFSAKQSAMSAIKALHQSQTMDGCSAPLVVKFADTQREKEQKKIQHMHSSILGAPTNGVNGVNGNGGVAATQLIGNGTIMGGGGSSGSTAGVTLGMASSPTSSLITNPPPQANPFIGADAISSSSLQLLQQLQAVGMQHQHLMQGLGGSPSPTDVQSALGGMHQLAPITVQNLLTMAAISQQQQQQQQQQQHMQHNHHHQQQSHQHQLQHQQHLHQPQLTTSNQQPLSSAQLTNAASSLWSSMPDSLSSAYTSAATLPHHHQYAGSLYSSSHQLTAANNLAAAAASIVNGKQVEGPDGCNLFIYHLPQEFTDTDLATTFLPFGTVLSAKVFIDKQTNLSKCFGFVSYDNALSAQAAIQAMHGFQIGAKRLKVQLKRSKEAGKPY